MVCSAHFVSGKKVMIPSLPTIYPAFVSSPQKRESHRQLSD